MFWQRFLTASVLLGVFLFAVFVLSRLYWTMLLAPGLVLASIEWARLAGYSRRQTAFFSAATLASYLVLVDVALTGWSGWGGANGLTTSVLYALAAGFWVIAAPLWLGAGWKPRQPSVFAVSGWLVLVPMWLALVELHANPGQLLFIMAVVWIADTAAYVVGRSIGRHRLAPVISPGKTWEGVGGSAVAVAVYYALASGAEFPSGDLWRGAGGLVVVSVVTVLSIEGDLFESWMKRQAGVKDSGQVLPGHGGLLDRIDGLTASLPVAALLLSALSPLRSG